MPLSPAGLRRRLLVAAGLLLAATALLVLLLRRDERTAWDQAALTRGRVQDDPVTLSLWANELGPLLKEAEALGPMPREAGKLLPWMVAQCSINLRLQAVQRRHGKPVETPQEMGRLPYCEDVAVVERALRRTAAGSKTGGVTPAR